MPVRRRDTRLPGWNYQMPGPYAVTICTHHRRQLLGEVHDARMVTNVIGRMVDEVWHASSSQFPTITLDAFVVMPNHVHAIVLLDADDIARNPELGAGIQWFKTITTIRYTNGVREQGWPPFDGRSWQRNYYEHFVRDDRDLDRCRAYVEANPGRWAEDPDNQPES
jgi:REP element-mobilizing transposase RayT